MPTIYSEALKALYGTVDASKLFFDDLPGFLLDDLGFKRNPYDWCVVNKIINGKQCTIVWHVDNLMISHVDPNVVTDILEKLSSKYGEMMPLSLNRGYKHEYLGMVFDFSGNSDVKITMYQYLDGLIEGAPDIYKVSSKETGVGMATPAPSNLYDIRDPNDESITGVSFLPEDEREDYHFLSAQCM